MYSPIKVMNERVIEARNNIEYAITTIWRRHGIKTYPALGPPLTVMCTSRSTPDSGSSQNFTMEETILSFARRPMNARS